ncbi:MAG: Ig-like domain-containing protein, partial [Betaproteobacteria bacterium]
LTFSATDGTATTYRTVQVRVFDVNRAPQIETANRALLVGQPLAIGIVRGASAAPGSLRVFDADGSAQTAELSVSFSGLPEGAHYDAASGRLLWTPGPGQVADHLVLATVSDGRNSVNRGFTLRVVADRAANAPGVLVNLTPSTPVLPGQQVLATVRAQGFSAIALLEVHARGAALGLADWTALTPDASGRLRLLPAAAGVAELRVRAVDADGFENTTVQTLRVRDPLDSAAPALAWGGALASSLPGIDPQRPITLAATTELSALIDERQLMGWVLEAAPAGGSTIDDAAWRVVAERTEPATASNGELALATLDPRLWPNGVLALRLRAVDLGGRTSEITARVQIDTATKELRVAAATDATFTIGGHQLALVRSFEPARTGAGNGIGDFGNWTLPLLSAQLSHDQPLLGGLDAAAAWREGARVWLQMPTSLALADAPTQQLAFTLRTQAQTLSAEPTAPKVLRPQFQGDVAGWTLRAIQDEGAQPPALQLQGSRLLERDSGLPWVPQRWELTAPDGTRYSLDASGRISAVRFTDGASWLVSDAGVALAGSADAQQRVSFERDSAGRIERVVGLVGDKPTSIVYRYDTAGRLAVVRSLYGEASLNLSLGYRADGSLMTEPLTAHLGTAGDWTATSPTPRNAWSGTLAAGAPAHFGFVVRDSELRSAAKLRGAAGTLIYAVETTGVDTPLVAEGATVVGRAQAGGRTLTLLRVTDAGQVRVTLAGNGAASLRISLGGDIDRDGDVDGADVAAWEAARGAGQLAESDLDGDGSATPADRQILYANYGFKANRAPVAQAAGQPLLTHTDLAKWTLLDNVAIDQEGDTVYWRVLGATGGTARLALDGGALLFQPDAGFAGMASVTVQADDGYAASEPIVLQFKVSGAALLAIHVREIAPLRAGQAAELQAFGDFADEKGVALTGNYLQWSVHNAQEGVSGLSTTASGQQLNAVRDGWGYVLAQRDGVKGVRVLQVGADGEQTYELSVQGLDVYPGSVTLAAPGAGGAGAGVRQIRLTQVYDGQQLEASAQTTYVAGDGRVVSVDASGRITALAKGTTRVYAIHKNKQVEITVHVAEPQPASPGQAIEVDSSGALLQTASGLQVAIAAGAFDGARNVRLQDLTLGAGELPRLTGAVSLGAFRLDLGGADSAMPIQLALPATGFDPAKYEMQVFRRAAVIHPDGTTREIWWLVDNGVIGADGVARTASPPYPGVYSGGDYWIRVHSKSVDAQTGAREVMAVVARVNWQAVVEFTVGIGMFVPSLMAGNTGAGLAYLATLLENANFIDLSVLEWTTTAQYWRTVLVENGAGVPIRVDLQPAAPRRVSDPVIHSIQRVSPNQFTLTGQNFNVPSGQTRLKAWIRPIGGAALSSEQRGNTQPIRGLIWTSFDVNVESDGSVKLQVPDDFAVGLHEVWLERTPSTLLPITAPRASEVFASNRVQFAQAQLAHDRDLEVWLDRSRLTFGKRNDDGGLEILPGEAITVPGGAEALTGLVGSKNRPLAYGPDGRVLFIAGYGKLFMVDVLSRKLVHTLDVPAASGRNFTSLALAGDWLYMAEGGSNEQLGPNPARLLRVNVNFKSPHFLSAIEAIDLPDSVQIGTNGILDMVVSGGRYLALTTPLSKGRTGLDTSGARGNVYVIDLLGNGSDPDPNRHLNVIDGTNVATVHFEPAAGPQSPGRYPMYVTTGPMTGQFLISTPGSYNQGLATAQVVEREPGTDEQLVVVSRSMPRLAPSGIASAWPGDFLQNIQKASGVAVTADGMWAFVADYNQPWAEPGFDFGWYALKQAGGKIGVIYDPFGSPRFMGATVPIENFMLDGLALSYDGRRLLATGIDLEWGSPHAGTVFDFEVSELIEAALWHGSAGKDLNVPLGLSDDLQPALLPARYLDGDRLHRPMAALTGQGLLDLVSPSFSTGDSERRPAFELKGTQPITALRLFISSFAEGEGLFPNDMPILPDWHLGDKNASGPAHDERIATIDIDLAVLPEFSNGAVPADQLITLSDFTRDEYLHFALTAGQKYWWGVEATFANGTSARKASQFKVAPAWKADTGRAGSYVTIITHGAQPPDNQTRLGAKPTLNEISGTRSVAARLPLTEMALSIANDQEGDAFIFDRALGEWVQLGDRSNKTLTEALQAKSPVILVNDWAWETFLSDSGFTEAAADGLYAALVQAHLDSGSKLLKGPLHLIGHSRGAVVNTELAQRILLGMYRPSGGIQMTTLDPHDFKQKSLTLDETISSLAFNAARKSFSQGLIDAAKLGPQILKRFLDEWFGEKEGDSEELKRAKKIGRKALDMTLTLPGEVALGPFKIILDLLAVLEITPAQLGLKEISFADQREPTIRAWEGIDYADNYFQVVANGDAEPSVTFTPNGRQLDDFDFNFNLTGLKAFTEDDSITPFGSLAVVHGRPVAWYYGT